VSQIQGIKIARKGKVDCEIVTNIEVDYYITKYFLFHDLLLYNSAASYESCFVFHFAYIEKRESGSKNPSVSILECFLQVQNTP